MAKVRPLAEAPAARARKGKSRITNGKMLLLGIDGRSAAARRYRDLYRAYLAAIGRDLNAIELGWLHEFVALRVNSEQLHTRCWNGEPVDIAELCTLTSTMMRLSARLGLNHKSQRTEDNIGPLSRLLRQDQEAQRERLAREREATS